MKYEIDYSMLSVTVNTKNNPLRVLNIKKEQILIALVLNNLDLTGSGILICLFTGLRIGELCALTWDDISIDCKMIHINKMIQRLQTGSEKKKTSIIISEPKSQSSIRDIPIASFLGELLINQPIKKSY